MLKLILVLFQIRLLSPIALFRLTSAIYKYGSNLMALLSFTARTYGERVALLDEREALTYKQLYTQSLELAYFLRDTYQLKSGKNVAFLCRNHASLVKSIFAVSLTGANIYMLNSDMSKQQLEHILNRHDFELLIYDEERSLLLEQVSYGKAKLFSYHETDPAIHNLRPTRSHGEIGTRRTASGKLILLTGGTTGNAKEAAHTPSLFHYLHPFYGLLTQLKLLDPNIRTAYIATPIYHGYGVAVLFLFLTLGKKVLVQRGFKAETACRLIRERRVDAVTVVPLMLNRMLKFCPADLLGLSCIASGSAELNPRLVTETAEQIGQVLYNLYGTSEAGLCVIGTPEDLRYSARTIGRGIAGVRLAILNEHQDELPPGRIGQLCVESNRSVKKASARWIQTGDLAYQDERGYYFLCGRVDDMIVSAGENVYPLEVEQVLLQHVGVEDAAVIGIQDEQYGQRLAAFVQLTSAEELTKEELLAWLTPRLARFQMPKEILFLRSLPYTSLGKLDKRELRSLISS